MALRSPWGIYGEEDALNMPLTYPALKPLAPPRPQPMGSQMSVNQSLDTGLKQGSTEAKYMTPEELLTLSKGIQSLPFIAEQKRNLEANKALFRQQLERQPNADVLTPLTNYLDFVTTGRYGSRVGPEKDYQSRIKDWAKQIQNEQGAYSQAILRGIGASKLGMETEQLMQTLRQGETAKAGTPTPKAGGIAVNADRFLKTYRTDPTIKSANEAILATKNILASVEQPSWLSDTNLRSSLVEAARLKPVSDFDVQSYKGPPDLLSQMEQLWGRIKRGDVYRPKDRQLIKNYYLVLAKKQQDLRNAHRHMYQKNNSATAGLSEEQATKILDFASPSIDFKAYEKPSEPKINIHQMILESLKSGK